MNKKAFFPILIVALALSTASSAQVIFAPARHGRYHPRPRPDINRDLPKFEPALSISVGYGFPNLDKVYLPAYYNAYQGNISQTGPITGSIDYQFSRQTSVGIMVTHGSVSAPYYTYNSSSTTPAFTAKFDNWSVMFNLVRYMATGGKVTPYLRTAIGINSWKQDYFDASGGKALVDPVDLPDLAYQAGIGAKFNVSKNAGLFVEAGYGKYLLQGGLALRF